MDISNISCILTNHVPFKEQFKRKLIAYTVGVALCALAYLACLYAQYWIDKKDQLLCDYDIKIEPDLVAPIEETSLDASLISKLELIKNYLSSHGSFSKTVGKEVYHFSDASQFFSNLFFLQCEVEKGGLDRENIKVGIDKKGKVVYMTINNVPGAKSLPKVWIDRLDAGWKKVLKLSSDYHSLDDIQILDRSLQECPEYHLRKFSELCLVDKVSHGYFSGLGVSFLKNNLEQEAGVDCGGPTRHFLSTLFTSLITSHAVNFHQLKGLGLCIPNAKSAVNPLSPSFDLTHDEESIYRQLGVVMKYCYKMNYTIGKLFDSSLFHALFSLTNEEIETPFEQLSRDAKLRMCLALVNARIDAGEENLDYLLMRIACCIENDGANAIDLGEVALNEYYAGLLPEKFIEDGQLDIEKVHTHREKFIDYLADAIFNQSTDSFGILGAALAPIHAIAFGMKRLQMPYDAVPFTKEEVDLFAIKVQGTLDRELVADSIVVHDWRVNEEVQKKTNWIKEWILDEKDGATEFELQKFLKYCTGATSLIPNHSIYIQSQSDNYSPLPHANTCGSTIYLSPQPSGFPESFNDHTRESFYKILRELSTASVAFTKL